MALVATVFSAPGGIGLGYGGGGHLGGYDGHGLDYYAYPKYSYNYGVADKFTGDQKSAGEVRDGPLTKGYYSVVQPDGVLRTVNYVVDPKLGFQAQVINKGIAGHPGLYKGYGHVGHVGHVGGYLG
ncbi:unnamed protein product [Orchesella dallaii]|uniref:Uncharacterized protein n=1 Tax=Orchesella dallaii TaxID=48710 RepID=A0ABP1RZZ4_9HEXA